MALKAIALAHQTLLVSPQTQARFALATNHALLEAFAPALVVQMSCTSCNLSMLHDLWIAINTSGATCLNAKFIQLIEAVVLNASFPTFLTAHSIVKGATGLH